MVTPIRGRLSHEEREQIADLADQGLNSGQIARQLNRLGGTINFHMATHGLRAPSKRAAARSYTRKGGVAVVPFSREEDAFIEVLRVQGYTTTQIADLSSKRFFHQRTPATIGIRLKMIASRDEP